jgi:uncharacterized membrane protein
MRNFRRIDIFLIVCLVAFCLLASKTLFQPGFFYSHDGILHTVRLAMFDQAIKSGQVVPRWSPQLAYGLGSPVLMFYGMLPNYLGSLFHLVGFNFQNAIKAVLSTSLVLSAIFFYFFAREKFGKLAGFVGALFYVWSPYRFVDVYVRGAVPESFAFVFPPLIFLSGEKLMEKPNKWWLTINAASICGIIISHNVLALVFVSAYAAYLLSRMVQARSIFKNNWISFVIGVGLSSFFLWPALLLQNQIHLEALSVRSYYLKNFVTLKQIIYSPWGWGAIGSTTPMSVQLGLAQWVGLGVLGLLLWTKWQGAGADRKFIIFFFSIMLATSIFLMTGASSLAWRIITPLQIVLYPWRFLSLAVFSTAILVSAAVSVFPKKYLIFPLLGLLFYANRNYLQVSVPFGKSDHYYSSYRGTTDVQGEFLPKAINLAIIKDCEKLDCHFSEDAVMKETFTNSGVIKISNLISLLSIGALLIVFIQNHPFKHQKKIDHHQ